MKKYIVKCEIYGNNRSRDCELIDGDYSGIEHSNKAVARSELRRAENDPRVFCAWIEETEGGDLYHD